MSQDPPAQPESPRLRISPAAGTGAKEAGVFGVLGFQGEEALGEPYSYEILVKVVSKEHTDWKTQLSLGTPVCLEWPVPESGTPGGGKPGGGKPGGGEPPMTRRHGILTGLSVENSDATGHLVRLSLSTRLRKLSLDQSCRLFPSGSLVETLKLLILEEDLAKDLGALPATDWPQDYRCQLEETRLDFLHRLCERYGVSYRFTQGDTAEKLVFLDGGGKTDTGPDLPMEAMLGTTRIKDHLTAYSQQARQLPARLVFRGHDPLDPGTSWEDDSPLSLTAQAGQGIHRIQGQRCASLDEATALAARRREGLEWTGELCRGEGCLPSFAAGDCFKLSGHLLDTLEGRTYRIIRIRHGWSASASGDAAAGFQSSLEAIPVERPYRPPMKTPLPRIGGQLYGRIAPEEAGSGKNAESAYATPDDKGRQKVLLDFDIPGQKKPAGDSRPAGEDTMEKRDPAEDGKVLPFCWLPRIQPYGGGNHGMAFPLHAGTDVVLTALNGDPDQLAIVGALNTSVNPALVKEGNRTQSVIRTAGGNEIRLGDQEGSRGIGLSTPGGTGFFLGDNAVQGSGLYSWVEGRGQRFVKGNELDVVQGMSLRNRMGLEVAAALGGRVDLSALTSCAITLGQATEISTLPSVAKLPSRVSLGEGGCLSFWRDSQSLLSEKEISLSVGPFIGAPRSIPGSDWYLLIGSTAATAALAYGTSHALGCQTREIWNATFPASGPASPEPTVLPALARASGTVPPLMGVAAHVLARRLASIAGQRVKRGGDGEVLEDPALRPSTRIQMRPAGLTFEARGIFEIAQGFRMPRKVPRDASVSVSPHVIALKAPGRADRDDMGGRINLDAGGGNLQVCSGGVGGSAVNPFTGNEADGSRYRQSEFNLSYRRFTLFAPNINLGTRTYDGRLGKGIVTIGDRPADSGMTRPYLVRMDGRFMHFTADTLCIGRRLSEKSLEDCSPFPEWDDPAARIIEVSSLEAVKLGAGVHVEVTAKEEISLKARTVTIDGTESVKIDPKKMIKLG